MKRVKSHIAGFDKLIEGGFPNNSTILLSGYPGTGKTIFSLEFLYNAAFNEKKKCIYFTFEEKKEALFQQAKQFGFDFENLEKEDLIKIISIGTEDISSNTINDILEIIKSRSTELVVIDSITTLSFITPESISFGSITEFSIKKFLYNFITKMNHIQGLTTIFISQKDEIISNNISEYLCDGVVSISSQKLGSKFNRNIQIKKMRKTNNDDNSYPMEISKNGIIIHSKF